MAAVLLRRAMWRKLIEVLEQTVEGESEDATVEVVQLDNSGI